MDLRAMRKTADLLNYLKKPTYAVLNEVAAQGTVADEAARAIAAQFGMPVCPIRLGQRVAFNRCLLAGQTAAEYEPGGKAAQEINSLRQWASETVGLSTGAKERKSTERKAARPLVQRRKRYEQEARGFRRRMRSHEEREGVQRLRNPHRSGSGFLRRYQPPRLAHRQAGPFSAPASARCRLASGWIRQCATARRARAGYRQGPKRANGRGAEPAFRAIRKAHYRISRIATRYLKIIERFQRSGLVRIYCLDSQR